HGPVPGLDRRDVADVRYGAGLVGADLEDDRVGAGGRRRDGPDGHGGRPARLATADHREDDGEVDRRAARRLEADRLPLVANGQVAEGGRCGGGGLPGGGGAGGVDGRDCGGGGRGGGVERR